MLSISRPTDMHVPSIVVTPALPSRNSLPPDMRAILDSIIGPVVSRPPTPHTEAVDWVAYGVPEVDDLVKSEETEVPYAPSHTHPAAAVNYARLHLDLANVRFSVGEVVSALEAKFRSLTGREPVSVPDTPVADDSEESPTSTLYDRSPAGSDSGSEHTVVAQHVLDYEVWEDADEEDALSAVHVFRRPLQYSGKGNPTWRHAMYVSPLVWPAERTEDDDRPASLFNKATILKVQLSRLVGSARFLPGRRH
ncbi:hypothetical protein OH77DRAFT_1012115 [Trametes cingulata]|nr:hypothetical protein OH77DRAFT_1012115 [Trametes cingulata]